MVGKGKDLASFWAFRPILQGQSDNFRGSLRKGTETKSTRWWYKYAASKIGICGPPSRVENIQTCLKLKPQPWPSQGHVFLQNISAVRLKSLILKFFESLSKVKVWFFETNSKFAPEKWWPREDRLLLPFGKFGLFSGANLLLVSGSRVPGFWCLWSLWGGWLKKTMPMKPPRTLRDKTPLNFFSKEKHPAILTAQPPNISGENNGRTAGLQKGQVTNHHVVSRNMLFFCTIYTPRKLTCNSKMKAWNMNQVAC